MLVPVHARVYGHWRCQSDTPPRIPPPSNSVAWVRKRSDTLGDDKMIGADTYPKLTQTDARKGARPFGKNGVGADACQNCTAAVADIGIWIGTPSSRMPFPAC